MPHIDSEELVFPVQREAPLVPPTAYERLRDSPPRRVRLRDGSRAWLVTRYGDVRSMLADRRVSSDHTHPGFPRLIPVPPDPGLMSFMRMDDPEHSRLRRMLAQEFTVRRMDAMRPGITAIVDALLGDLAEQQMPADLVATFALPLSSLVICQLLGVPYEDHDFFQERSKAVLVTAATHPQEGAAAMADLAAYLDGLITAKQSEPGDDLLSRMLTDYVSSGNLSHAELVSMARLLLMAGHETTANMIGLSVVLLLQVPDQLAELRQKPELMRSAIDEMLRYLTVIQGGARVALADIEIGGTPIEAGEGLIYGMLAANLDSSVFPNGDVVDIHRDARQHMAFGYGVHQCLGQSLARVEMDIALTRLFSRFPRLELAAPVSEIPFRGDVRVYGLDELPVRW